MRRTFTQWPDGVETFLKIAGFESALLMTKSTRPSPSRSPAAKPREHHADANPLPGAAPDSFEFSVLKILKEQRLLRITGTPLMLINCWVDVSINNHDIFPTIVVIVDKNRAPTQKWQGNFAEPG